MPFIKSDFSIPLEELQLAAEVSAVEQVKGFRPVCLKSGVFGGTRGSAYAEFGRTRVLAQVHGPREDGQGDFHSGRIIITLKGCEEEKLRAQLTSAMSGVTQLNKYAKSQIEIEIAVLSNDGGILQAALVASSLALVHAGIEVLDVLVAAHVSVSESGEFSLDPAGTMPTDDSHVTVAIMPNINQVVCCDVRGCLPARTINDAISHAQQHALRLCPVVRSAITNALA